MIIEFKLFEQFINESKIFEKSSKWITKDNLGKELFFVNQTHFPIQVPPYISSQFFDKPESEEYKKCEKKCLDILEIGGYTKFKWTKKYYKGEKTWKEFCDITKEKDGPDYYINLLRHESIHVLQKKHYPEMSKNIDFVYDPKAKNHMENPKYIASPIEQQAWAFEIVIKSSYTDLWKTALSNREKLLKISKDYQNVVDIFKRYVEEYKENIKKETLL